jgi:hypothetical protein
LRENLGLRRPVNRFAVKQQEKTLALAWFLQIPDFSKKSGI